MASTSDGSQFMRPFVLGWTVYILGIQILSLASKGRITSPDSWSEIYILVLGTYAAAPEIKRWTQETGDPEVDDWAERLRKGGPLIVLWNLLLAASGLLRIIDQAWPVPQELKSLTLQVTGLFFGTYALRQVRRRAVEKAWLKTDSEQSLEPESVALNGEALLLWIQKKGPQTPAALVQGLNISRRTLNRLLQQLVQEGRLTRQGRYPTDPQAVYRIP